jgi:hypothetical protein
VDFKGWFETKDGLRCYPLTNSDAYSRYLICCEGVRDPNGNRVAPGKPQQNGRHERMHRTLGFEVDVQGDLPRQQRAFDLWRAEFNEERPHAALGQKPPASVYTPSSLVYPRRLLSPYPGAWSQTARVDKEGFISFDRRKVLIAKALRHQDVELVRVASESFEVRWVNILLGRLEGSRPRAITSVRRKRGSTPTLFLDPEACAP